MTWMGVGRIRGVQELRQLPLGGTPWPKVTGTVLPKTTGTSLPQVPVHYRPKDNNVDGVLPRLDDQRVGAELGQAQRRVGLVNAVLAAGVHRPGIHVLPLAGRVRVVQAGEADLHRPPLHFLAVDEAGRLVIAEHLAGAGAHLDNLFHRARGCGRGHLRGMLRRLGQRSGPIPSGAQAEQHDEAQRSGDYTHDTGFHSAPLWG